MISIFRKEEDINSKNYFIVNYYLESKNSLREAAWNLAIGQSIGNPNNRSAWETDQMFLEHSCFILEEEESDFIGDIVAPIFINNLGKNVEDNGALFLKVCGIFGFVLINNLMGMVPYADTATASLIVTL